MAKDLISIRISESGKQKLDYLAARYGTQTTVIEVAIDRLYMQEEAMTVQYQYWQHKSSGETFAVRIENGQPAYINGPLHYSEVEEFDPADYNYDDPFEDDSDNYKLAQSSWATYNRKHTARWLGVYNTEENGIVVVVRRQPGDVLPLDVPEEVIDYWRAYEYKSPLPEGVTVEA